MTTTTGQQGFDIATLKCAAGTDVGLRREENQDSFGVVRHEAFQAFFVADGMGGVKGGAIASRLAISTLEAKLPELGVGVSPESVSRVVTEINAAIFEQGNAQPGLAGMGTTIVGLVFTPEGIISLNVGDSRAYRVRGDSIHQISEDHTLVRELVRSGAISSNEASHHPVSHMLTRSLGPLAEVIVECRREPEAPQDGDIYVLCSDGLYNFVSDKEILDVVRQNPLDDANQILINLANRRGGTDNITVLVVSVGDVGARRRGDLLKSRELGASANPTRDVQEVARSAGSFEVEPSVVPPRVEEPRDYHAERESLKERKKNVSQETRGVPVVLLLSGAVLFGLVVGDVARRWGAFPDFTAILDPGASGARERMQSITKLDELSKELAVSGSRQGSREGLPDIARRVSDSHNGLGLGGLKGSRRDLMALNKSTLESAASKIESHIKELDLPPSPESLESLKRAEEVSAMRLRELSEIEASIDATSRKLSLWFGRKKKAEELQHQDLSSVRGDVERVGAISESVKRKAAELIEATYQLQAKQDESELYPSNDGLRREVEALRKNRAQLQEEVRDEVIKAIDGVLADTYRQLEELKARRDIVAGQVSAAQEESEYLRTVTSADPEARAALQRKLKRELEDIRAAISEIKG